jgi:hypothetical protein
MRKKNEETDVLFGKLLGCMSLKLSHHHIITWKDIRKGN